MGEVEDPAVWLVGGVERDKQAASRTAKEPHHHTHPRAQTPQRVLKAMHGRKVCLSVL